MLCILQGWNTEKLKEAWNAKIDGQLNAICRTTVLPKEEFQEWRICASWSNVMHREGIVKVLSKRLQSIYEERIALREWTIGVDYKTLRQEHDEVVVKSESQVKAAVETNRVNDDLASETLHSFQVM